MDFDRIAKDLWLCAVSWQPTVRLVGNVRADEIAALMQHILFERRVVNGAEEDEYGRLAREKEES